MKTGILVLAALVASGSAIAAAPAARDGATQADAAQQKKICKTERSTGSLTRSRRICMTQAEWDQLRRSTKQDIDDMQRNGGAIPRVQGGAGATAGTG